LPWEPRKLETIAEYLDIQVNDLLEKYYGSILEDKNNFHLDYNKMIPCPFLIKADNGISSCKIYETRPTDCESFPTDPFRVDFMSCPSVKHIFDKLKKEDE